MLFCIGIVCFPFVLTYGKIKIKEVSINGLRQICLLVYFCFVFLYRFSKIRVQFKVYVLILKLSLQYTIYILVENLSRRNTTVLTQSSTYDKNVASLANDGVLNTSLAVCGYTNPGHSKSWLQVDLSKPFNVKRISIIYRKEGMYFNKNMKR